MFPKAKKYSDYRRMLDKEHKNIDAIAVTTSNHMHIPINVMAMKMGKDIFCQKPLGRNVQEVRVVTRISHLEESSSDPPASFNSMNTGCCRGDGTR
jgi:predicted dehydrogenase